MTVARHPARRIVALVATTACLVAVAPAPAEAARPREERFAAMVDEVRQTAGKSSMNLSDRLSKVARRHSRRMAAANRLFHSNLSRLLGKGGGAVAENVGYAGDLPQLLRMFLNSPAHAKNLLGKWSKTGIGIVKARGRFWVTQIFRS